MYQKRDNMLEIISLFRGDYHATFYLREIMRATGIPLRTCQNKLSQLEEEGILLSRTEGKNRYFFLNLNNIKVKFRLLSAEIYKTEEVLDKYPPLKMFLKEIKTNTPIILFGSFAVMANNTNSDIDLLTVSKKEEKLPLELLPYETHRIVMSEKTFRTAVIEEEALMKEIEKKHVILNNHSFYVNTMWMKYGK